MSSLAVAVGRTGRPWWPGRRHEAAPVARAAGSAATVAAAAGAATFRPDVEGLRGIAILFVLLFHAELAPVPGGFVGVDVFFVISGFLITGLLLRERERSGRIDLVGFYGRRVRRLLPAALLAVAVILPVATAASAPLDRPALAVDGATAAISLANVRFALAAGDYFAAVGNPSPFLHFWSLSVEEQFYLAWPFLLLLGARGARPRLGAALALGAVLVASFAACIAVTDVAPGSAFYLLPTRAWQLATGGLLAIGWLALARLPAIPMAMVGWAGLAAVMAAPFVVDPSAAYPGVAALLPTLGTAALIAAGERRGSPARLLAIRPLRFLGRISYSLYLWHWPILVLPAAAVAVPLDAGVRAALVLAAVGVATLSWACVEEPFRRGSWRLAVRPSRSLAAAAVGLTFVVAFSGGLWVRGTTNLGLAAAWLAGEPPVGGIVDEPIDWSGDPVAAGGPGEGEPGAGGEGGDAPGDGSALPEPLPAAGSPGPAAPTAPPTASPDPSPTTPAAATTPPPATPAPPVSNALPKDVRPSVARARDDTEVLRRNGCLAFEPVTAAHRCVFGDRSSRYTVALVGDSHASHLFPAVEAVAERRGWRLETYVKVACPFIDMRVRNLALKREYTECTGWRASVLEHLAAAGPDLVLVSSSRWIFPVEATDRTVVRQGEALARIIEKLPGRVVIVADTPAWNLDVPACLSSHARDIRACAMPRKLALSGGILARERAATRATGAGLVNLTRAICDADPCPAVVNGRIVLRDSHHLTATFARSLAPVLNRALDRLIETALAP